MAPRRVYGETWWGKAWIAAVEARAVHDPNRLPRGKNYAGRHDPTVLSVSPGAVSGRILGSRPDPYTAALYIREFRDDEWEVVVDAIVAKAAHSAALLDGELASGIAEDAAALEVDLLPRSGELRTACSCPDDAEPCKHAAAVCYLMALALDRDPFLLLELRGLTRDQVLDAVRARRAAVEPPGGGAEAETPTPDFDDVAGVDPAEAWHRALGPLPTPPKPIRTGPGKPAPWAADPPLSAPFAADGLRRLATDAARRAWAMRTDRAPAHLDLPHDVDLARRAANASELERRAMATRAGLAPAQLDAVAAAWEFGGARAVHAEHEAAWNAPPLELARAKDHIESAGFGTRSVRVRSNRITVDGHLQFRRSRDGHWYLYEKEAGRWLLAAPPSLDLDDLLWQ